MEPLTRGVEKRQIMLVYVLVDLELVTKVIVAEETGEIFDIEREL